MKLISDVRADRKITLELTEKELAYIICAISITDGMDVRVESELGSMDIVNIMNDEEVELLSTLELIYKGEV